MLEPYPADRLVAAAALARYDLPPESRLRPIRATNNAVFEVTTDDPNGGAPRYVLRVHRPGYRSVAQTWSELYLLRLLQDALPDGGFSVPRPVPARDGALARRGEPRPRCGPAL